MKKNVFWMLIIGISILFSICIGRYGLSMQDIIHSILFMQEGVGAHLIYTIRLPRILMAVLCGMSLSCAGMIFQSLFKNGLASPDILGTTSGCSFGAVLAILLGNSFFGVEIFSFGFGLLSLFFVFFMSKNAKGNRMFNLLIGGIIVQAIFTSMIMALKILADPYQQLPSMEYWMMGGLSDVNWFRLCFSAILILICLFVLYKLRWVIQILSFGEEANTLGINVGKMRLVVLVLSTILVSSVVSVAGPVSWVGLMIPHFVRQWKKESISKSFCLTAFLGALFVLWSDTLARSLFLIELPISIVTSFFGAIYLLIVLKKGNRIV